MKRVKNLRRIAVAAILVSILMAASIAFIRGGAEQENSGHGGDDHTAEENTR